MIFRKTPILPVAALLMFGTAICSAQIDVEIIAGPNVIVDSNVLSPSTYAPDTFTVQVKYCNNTGAPIDDIYAHIGNIDGGGVVATPGTYAVRDSDTDAAFQAESPHLANTGDYSFAHAAVTADATRYIGTLNPGECEIIYWMVCYPRVSNDGSEPVWGETRLEDDDLWLEMDAWASQPNAGTIDPGNSIGEDSHVATMKNSISAMANKIGGPTGGVWTVTDLAGDPVDTSTPALPGDVIKVCGTGFRIGVDNKGFDTDPDFAFDYGVWIQPVGDKSLFDPSCYRLVRTEGQLRISRSGGNPTYTLDFVNQTYFRNLPNDTNGGLGDVCYFLVAMGGPCSAALSPYQLVASGSENEKFNADYGSAVPRVVTGESLVDLTKTVDLENAAAGAALTYDITFTNPPGSDPLGLPEYGLPVVVNETIPTGTTYVGGSAEGVVAGETTANSISAGSGGFLDVHYSTDGGASYSTNEPGDPTTVTNIQWWLDSPLLASGTVFVQFQVLVDDPFSGVPLVDNTVGLSFGTGPIFKEDDAGTLISGDNAISGMVWEDADYSDTLNSETQTTGIAVTLYYDVNGDGLVNAGDIVIATQDTGAPGSLGGDADSTYAFTNLPDGNFIVVVDRSDPDLPAGYSLPDSYTDTYAIDLDAAGASGTGVEDYDNDWAFIPALTVTKTADLTTYGDGELVTFEIHLENHMAPVPAIDCSRSGFAARAVSAIWTNPENAQAQPDPVFAQHAAANNDDAIDFGGFDMGAPTPTDTINSIDVVIRNYYQSGPFDLGGANPKPDYIDIEAWDGTGFVDVIRLDYTTLHNYIGSANQGDITIAIPPAIVTAWTWAVITSATQDIFRISFETQGSADGVTAFVDAIELVVSCPAPPPATTGTSSPSTIDPLPLTDSYDPAKLQYVSASLTPTSVDGGTGAITWDNVGPLHAGNRKTIEVTFLALTPPDTGVDGEPDPTTTTNSASSSGALFLNGDPTNDASDTQDIDIIPAGSIGDYVYWDVDGSGSQNAGDLPMQGVTVELLDGVGTVIASTTTDAAGFYEFAALGDADYTVRIAASNFAAGGVLEGFSQTDDPDGGTANESDVTINNNDGISTNDAYTDQDFGYDMSNNLISGTLWYDYDGDGIQGPNEPPIVGQTVNLSGGGSATTDANGFYVFSDVPDGSYTVSTTAPGGTVLTTTANPIPVDADSGNLVDGTLFPDNDFGFQPSGSITLGDTVYVDWDGDGAQGAGEEGIENISVYLVADINGNGAYDPAVDALVATDVTDASGVYGFAGLASGGDYLVIVDTTDPDFPSNLSQTEDPDGTLDSTGEATGILASDDTFDFGYQPLGSGSIGDTVFVDADSDGIHDSGEAGIALITVTLYEDSDGDGEITAADAVVGTTETDLLGNYLFANLAPGDYLVDVDGTDAQLPTETAADGSTTLNYIPTSSDPHAVTLAAGEAYAAADFGFAPGGAIGNFVWQDLDGDGEFDDTEPPISGMTVNLYIDTDGNGTGDVLIGTTTTDPDGLYLFDTYNDGGTNTGLPAGDYVVEIITSGTQTVTYDLDGNNDTTTPVALLPGQTFGAADFGVNDSSTLVIGDTVWIDSDGDGIVDENETLLAGVKVELIAADGFTVVDTVYTDSFGSYSFGVPDDGATYSVVVDESTLPFAGLVNTSDKDADLDSDSGQFTLAGADVPDADFGYQFSGAFGIAGTVFNDTNSSADWQSSTEPTYADVVVYLWFTPDGGATWINIDSQLSGANGSYSFDGYPAGTYTVAVSPGSPVLIGTSPTTPQNQQITVVDQSISGIDFGFVGSASIGDTIFYDTSGDGVQQGGETGIPGIQVTLTYPNGQTVTTTTDSNGNYLFEGLGEGPFTITVDDSTLPSGTTNTGDPDGTKDSTTLVNLVEGQTYDAGDFGYQAPGEASIGDTIWADLNGDGIFDPDGLDDIAGNTDDEFGIEGVVVELYDANDPAHDQPGIDPPLATTTSDADGVYGFAGLIAGDYFVRVDPTGALAGYDPTYDEDGGTATPDSLTPVILPTNTSVHDTADFGYSPNYASISGTVYDDAASDDGLIVPAEDTPIAGVTVELWSDPDGDGDPSDGVVLATTVTDSNGTYSFDDQLPGDYVVVETDPAGFTSDADTGGANDNWIPVDLQGVASSGNDFLDDGGMLSAIGGVVYNDIADDDLLNGSGESPVAGVTVTLYKDTDGDGIYTPGTDVAIDSAVTGADGRYLFGNLADGDYLVVETDPATATSDTDTDGTGTNGANTVAIALAGIDDLDNHFLDDMLTASITGSSLADTGGDDILDFTGESPIGGAVITLFTDPDGDGDPSDGTAVAVTVTATDGSYGFTDLAPGDYVVVETQPSGFPTSDDDTSTLIADGTDNWVDVNLDGSGTTSAGNSFLNDGGTLYQFGGSVFLDAADDDLLNGVGEDPIAAVVISLFKDLDGDGILDPGEPLVDTTVTASDGSYLFGGLVPGDYIVIESNPGIAVSDDDTEGLGTDDTIAAAIVNSDSTGNDFLDDGIATYAITGQVRDDYDADGEPSDLDRPIPGVDLSLYLDTNNNDLFDAGDVLIDTTETDGAGGYSFENLPDGEYLVVETQPQGATSTYDAEGGPVDDLIAVTISGADVSGRDYLEALDPQGYFYFSTTGEIIPGGSISVSGPGTADISQDGSTGQYAFTVDQPGTYVIAVTAPPGYQIDPNRPDSGTLDPTGQPDPFEVGSSEDATNPGYLVDNSAPANVYYLTIDIEAGDPLVLNNNIPLIVDKSDAFADWQTDNPLGGSNAPADNPDGDLYDNALEYAFCLKPDSGTFERAPNPGENGGFCVELGGPTGTSNTVDAFFTRRLGNFTDVTYTLEVAPAIGSPPAWVTSTAIPQISDNGDGTETVTYPDLEAQFASGIARLKVEIDGDSTGPHYTPVFGWSTVSAQAECETCSNPYAPKELFAGVVDSVSGANNEVLDLAVSAGSGDISAQLANRPHYIEIVSGACAGHRFDLASATATTITLDTGSARNTLDPIPDLSGEQLALRAHDVLDDFVSAQDFVDTVTPGNNDNPATAGRLLFYDNVNGWESYFAYNDSGALVPAIWTSGDNSGLENVGNAVLSGDPDDMLVIIDPCEAFYVHCKAQSVDILMVGIVREWDFACPLNVGYNLVGSAYPADQSPAGRDMDDKYFTGTTDPWTADQIEFWMSDGATFGLEGYDSHFRVDTGDSTHWTTQENSSLVTEDAIEMFKIQRGAFINSRAGNAKTKAGAWTWPVPWDADAVP